MKLHFGFDLVKFLACEELGSARSISAMIRNLPEGARFTAIMSAPDGGERPPLDAEVEEMLDRKLWTTDRLLQAQLINAVRDLTRVTGSGKWEKGKEPDFPIVGPASWREPAPGEPTPASKPKTVDDVFNMMMGH